MTDPRSIIVRMRDGDYVGWGCLDPASRPGADAGHPFDPRHPAREGELVQLWPVPATDLPEYADVMFGEATRRAAWMIASGTARVVPPQWELTAVQQAIYDLVCSYKQHRDAVDFALVEFEKRHGEERAQLVRIALPATFAEMNEQIVEMQRRAKMHRDGDATLAQVVLDAREVSRLLWEARRGAA